MRVCTRTRARVRSLKLDEGADSSTGKERYGWVRTRTAKKLREKMFVPSNRRGWRVSCEGLASSGGEL